MIKQALVPLFAASALLAATVGAGAQSMAPMHGMKSHMMMHKSSMSMSHMEHGMPTGKAGADGISYLGKPDLQAAISLVTAGGAPGHFSIAKALTALAGDTVADAEIAKLTKQYGKTRFMSFVTVQNYTVNDAVKIATNAGVKFPKPTMHGKALAATVVKLGLEDGTYYEGVQLDHLVTHAIHEHVMDDIDQKYGTAADANYHRIADQAHYDLAHALGMSNVKLASYH
ncbi:MAG: hypothetical protein GIX03_09980 [Candidatus Eremiobacteraeota bacterium]|nr:hypothetical protein [Candidatus Eremiobacteraeota bacterium]MBC5803298.1 hypothetical protein [Candidatus Eremiobacteraeota bacterium]MBC5822923.1 hypothetical protein [Candidatus Eremiobacteraeota bacterium]